MKETNPLYLFHKSPDNLKKIFWGKNLYWHAAAISLTAIIVASDFDWVYFRSTRSPFIQATLFPAAIIGAFLPVIVPLVLYLVGLTKKHIRALNSAYAIAQAGLIGVLVSFIYKTFTGRVPPEVFNYAATTDISKQFRFGFMRGGVFWGWPSTHTTVAFAMSSALMMLYPEDKPIKFLAILYAVYVGIGVSATIHWFSEFAAGAILGTMIGVTVGRSFILRLKTKKINR